MGTNEIKAEWFNPSLNIAYVDYRNVYILPDTLLKMEAYKGEIYYRKRGTSKRISKSSIMKNLIKKETIIQNYLPF